MKLSKRMMTFVIGGTLLTATVVACNHGMRFGTAEERGEWIVEKVSKELELNATQEANLIEVKNGFLSLRADLSDDRSQMKTEVLAMLQQPTLDRDKMNAMVNGQMATINSRSPLIIDAVANFYDSLDDTQRSELREFIQHKIEHHHGHRYWH
jgi:hypothetical protein